MKITLHIEADTTADLDDAIRGLAKTISGVTQVSAEINTKALGTSVETGPIEVKPTGEPVEKKTRAKKADKPLEVVSSITLPDDATSAEVAEAFAGVKSGAKAPVPEMTADEVKSCVIDYLNDATEYDKKSDRPDPEVRAKALHKVIKHITGGPLMKLTELINGNKDRWADIIAFVDERRAELKADETTTSEEE